MLTGVCIKQLKLFNFGNENITTVVSFDQVTSTTDKECVFEAIRCLFAEDYLNEGVTKPKDEGNDSSVEMIFTLDGGEEIHLERFFGRNGYVRFDVPTSVAKDPKKFWKFLFPFKMIRESCFTTPANLVNEIMDDLYRRLLAREKSCEKNLVCAANVRQHASAYIPLQERDEIVIAIQHDLRSHADITKLKKDWVLSTQNQLYKKKKDWYFKISKFAPVNPMGPIDFSEGVVNVFLDFMKRDISLDQMRTIKFLLKEAETELEGYPQDGNILHSASWSELQVANAKSIKSREYETNQSIFYRDNPSIVSTYKELFPTSGAWENEKENFRQKSAEERQFRDEINRQRAIQASAKESITQKIGEAFDRIQTLTDRINVSYNCYAAEMMINEVYGFLEYISFTIQTSFNEYCLNLCELLNDVSLEIADTKTYIAGMFQNIINNPSFLQTEYLFDDITVDDGLLNNILQNYLAPLSKVLYVSTPEMAMNLLDMITQETFGQSEAAFILVAKDTIQQQEATEMAQSHLLTNMEGGIAYNITFENLLSNLRFTNDKKCSERNSNLLNFHTKKRNYPNKEKAFAAESRHLFTSLQKIKKLYLEIGNIQSEANEFVDDTILAFEQSSLEMNEHYRIESDLRSECLTVQVLNFDALNITNTLNVEAKLLDKSNSREKIYENLLKLQDETAADNARFLEALSQQTKDVSELSFVVDQNSIRDTLNMGNSQHETLEANIREYFSGIYRHNSNNAQCMRQKFEWWSSVAESDFIEHNDALRENLLTTSRIDLMRYFHSCGICHTRVKIRKNERSRYNSSYEEIYGRIDLLISQLRFPMVSATTLKQLENKLELLDKKEIVEEVISVTKNELFNLGQTTKDVLDALCSKLTAGIVFMTQKEDYSVHYQLMTDDLDNVEWDKCSTVLKRCDPKVRFYAKYGTEPVTDLDDAIAILLYIYYIEIFTIQPILLNRLLERCNDDFIKRLYELLKHDVSDRFSLIRVPEGFDLPRSPPTTAQDQNNGGDGNVEVDQNVAADENVAVDQNVVADQNAEVHQIVESDRNVEANQNVAADENVGVDQNVVAAQNAEVHQNVESDRNVEANH